MEHSPSNSAGPTPTMIIDIGSDAACTGDNRKDNVFIRSLGCIKIGMNNRGFKRVKLFCSDHCLVNINQVLTQTCYRFLSYFNLTGEAIILTQYPMLTADGWWDINITFTFQTLTLLETKTKVVHLEKTQRRRLVLFRGFKANIWDFIWAHFTLCK